MGIADIPSPPPFVLGRPHARVLFGIQLLSFLLLSFDRLLGSWYLITVTANPDKVDEAIKACQVTWKPVGYLDVGVCIYGCACVRACVRVCCCFFCLTNVAAPSPTRWRDHQGLPGSKQTRTHSSKAPYPCMSMCLGVSRAGEGWVDPLPFCRGQHSRAPVVPAACSAVTMATPG